MPAKEVLIIGYSGHAYVVCDALQSSGAKLVGYCENTEKSYNPFALPYLGSEREKAGKENLQKYACFIAIGDNTLRWKISRFLEEANVPPPVNAVHIAAHVSGIAKLGNGILVAPQSTINPLVQIGNGAICNTGSIIEHECKIGNFAHVAPGAVLAGNVTVGDRAFVGAGAVVKQGVTIGKDAVIGAGTVVIRDVPDGATLVGNPGRELQKSKNHL